MKKNIIIRSSILVLLFPLFFSCKPPVVVEKPFITHYILKNQTNSEIKIIEFYQNQSQKIYRIKANDELDTVFSGTQAQKLFNGDSMHIYEDNILVHTYINNNKRYCKHNLYKLGTYRIIDHKEKDLTYEFDFKGNNLTNLYEKQF